MKIEIYPFPNNLPSNWNTVVAKDNILLSQEYFSVLIESKPINMECYYVGYFIDNKLIGGALIQRLYFSHHNTYQKKKWYSSIKNFVSKNYTKDVLILGNNMLTGQNGFYFDLNKISYKEAVILLEESIQKIQKIYRKASLIIFKDYQYTVFQYFKEKIFASYFTFSVQPNMILKIRPEWNSYEDYLQSFSTKYRTRAKTARNKSTKIQKRELTVEYIRENSSIIHQLYKDVADNASFNTFFLAKNHFEILKFHFEDNFKIIGYFLNNQLVGFYSLIINYNSTDTYFLGYNKEIQKEYQLYLNMLLDMVEFGIHNNSNKIIFGRTALEIKSTIGAQPIELFGLIKHNNPIINKFMYKIFPRLDPKIDWIQRNPFK